MIPRDAVSDLVPFTHVADVDRSVAFYERLGFEMRHEHVPEDHRVWAFLERGDARLMVAEIDGERVGVLSGCGAPGAMRRRWRRSAPRACLANRSR